MSKNILCVIVLALLLLNGCASNPDVQLVELSKNTVVYDEIIRINNCGGKGDSEQTASREFATTVEFGAGVSAGYQSILQGNLSAKYSEYRNTSKSQRLVAPPGTNMEFVLRWSDDVRAGNVQVNGKSGTYEVRIPVSVEQISSRDLGCGISAPQPATPTNPTQAPIITQPVQQPDTALVNRLFLGSNVSLSSLVRDIQNPSQVSQEQLESVVRTIQSEADRLHSARVESNSTTLSADNWWLVWCSNVPAQYSQLPTGWSYLFGQKLPTFGQLYVVSPTAQNRLLESCNSPKGWWAVVVYLDSP